ncbi:YggS family pyridoxal phosphate-dependent enzyme [Inquilinus limosus]|uniref:YggS family pyridoxal phosphate-dependent enzyme n=1 Tax=Inquilinus limosus TaxID=171674 RepID=UPI0003F8CA05|nr:YggS family pyridoxal phosphate-dependent enzyme [Inquilinus limosus]
MTTITLAESLASLRSRIEAAARAAGRDPAAVTLVAVSKVQPDDRIEAALAAGQRVFGENRVQEAQARWAARREARPDLELRLIGPLQTNKAKDAVRLFDVIETVDRPKLARSLAEAMAATGRRLDCLIQVNTGEEPQKAGVVPRETEDLYRLCTEECGLPVRGLMCIPPVDEPPALHFALLADLAGKLGLPVLSMGMSDDFEVAVRYGATHVRVGTALFGARVVPPRPAEG